MQNFFEQEAKGIQLQYTYVETPSKIQNYSLVKEIKKEISSPVLEWIKTSDIKNKEDLFGWSGIVSELLKIHNRPLYEKPIEYYRFNGCCIPGQRRLYVNAKGKFYVCERVGNAPSIGDVYTGIDVEKTKRIYVNEYMNSSIEDCKHCWLINMCGVCYAGCYGENGFSINEKKELCKHSRFSAEQALSYYHFLINEDPQKLEAISKIQIM